MAVLEQPITWMRDAEPEDLPSIVAIENEAFKKPWSPQSLAAEIRRPLSVFRLMFLDRLGSQAPAGFVCIWHVADEAHILKLAVDRRVRRLGLGSELLTDTLSRLGRAGARLAYLEVRASNATAQVFYEAMGFEHLGVRPRYYEDTGEDAHVYCKALP